MNHLEETIQKVAPTSGASLVKNFKSGSDAMTVLVNQNGKLYC